MEPINHVCHYKQINSPNNEVELYAGYCVDAKDDCPKECLHNYITFCEEDLVRNYEDAKKALLKHVGAECFNVYPSDFTNYYWAIVNESEIKIYSDESDKMGVIFNVTSIFKGKKFTVTFDVYHGNNFVFSNEKEMQGENNVQIGGSYG